MGWVQVGYGGDGGKGLLKVELLAINVGRVGKEDMDWVGLVVEPVGE